MASTATKQGSLWLLQAKQEIAKTAEWEELTSELLDAIEQQLSENRVKYFSDLAESEKSLFLERAAKLLQGNSPHKRLVSKVSELLDKHLNENVAAEILNPLNTKTKTDLILGRSCDASFEILRRWPDLKNKLFRCLNRPLRGDLRKAIWSIFLFNPKIRTNYLHRINVGTADSSVQDSAVMQNCQALLCAEPSFKELSSNPAVHFAMGKILSYRQFYLKTASTLLDTDYLLLVPFVKVFIDVNDSFNSGEVEIKDEQLARISESYLTFLDSRPLVSKDTGTKESLAAQKQFGIETAKSLESKDYHLASHLKKIYLNEKSCVLSDGLAALLRSYVRCLFVGFLDLHVVCFIWDQIILTIKADKLQVIPAFCVVLMILLKEKLLKCQNVRNLEDVLLENAKRLTVRNFQAEMEDKFIPEWISVVNSDQHSYALPLVDPLASAENRHPWSSWFTEHFSPSITRPEDRLAARQGRENDRRLQIEKRLREERDRRKELELAQKQRDEEMKEKQMEQQQHERDKMRLLQEQLEAERSAHQRAEAQMTEEIARLKLELERRQLPQSTSPPQVRSTPRASRLTQRSAQSQTPQDEANDVARMLIGQVMGNVDLLIHGRGYEKRELDHSTRASQRRRSVEYREVMQKLFGRELTNEDWDRMGDEERRRKTDLLLRGLKDKL